MKEENNFPKNSIGIDQEDQTDDSSYVLRKIELTSSCVIGGFFELAAR